MKKYILALFFISLTLSNFAQGEKLYNKWSIDFGLGFNNLTATVSDGVVPNSSSFGLNSLGLRYMFNDKFGLRASFGYHEFTAAAESDPFKANYNRFNIEAVINAGNLLGFDRWTDRFNLLAYAGLGSSSVKTLEPIPNGPNSFSNFNIGFTPQYKISDKISLFVDVAAISHSNYDFRLDGNPTLDNDDFSLFNIGFGVNIALGSELEHADFYRDYFDSETTDLEENIEEAAKESKKKERKRRSRRSKRSKSNKKLDGLDEKVKEEINEKKEVIKKQEDELEANKDELRKKERELKKKEQELKRKAREEIKKQERELRQKELELRRREKEELKKLKMATKKRMLTNQEIDSIKLLLASMSMEIKSLNEEIKNATASPSKEIIMTDLDKRYVKKEEMQTNRYVSTVSGGNVSFIRELLGTGYVNVYFDTNKTTIQDGSINAINYLKEFLNDNPYFRANLIGYADETGSFSANERLSYRRAKAVYDILVDAGVNPSRLTFTGAGVDQTVSGKANQLARRVTFKIVQ